MPVRTRRWDDPREPGDGFRVLICRYRPRALPKADETWDVWWKELGPSKALHADFYEKTGGPPLAFADYRRRYLAEMQDQWWRIADLVRRHAAGETITLLCSSACTDASRCHRSILASVVEAGALPEC
jgi:uncharacterized protein YeaO (DUF488 family)